MRSGSRLVIVVVSLLFGFQTLMFAQSATTSLRGTVYDPKGAVVSGATVTLINPATAFSRITRTDGQGGYQFLELPPAKYDLTVSAAGFAPVETERSRTPRSDSGNPECHRGGHRWNGNRGSCRYRPSG